MCLVAFSSFGVFYLVSMQTGFLVPFGTYRSFFPNFAALVSTQPFSSLATGIFGSGAGSSSNPMAPVFDYLPIYFAFVGSLVIILGTEGKKLMSRFTLDSAMTDSGDSRGGLCFRVLAGLRVDGAIFGVCSGRRLAHTGVSAARAGAGG